MLFHAMTFADPGGSLNPRPSIQIASKSFGKHLCVEIIMFAFLHFHNYSAENLTENNLYYVQTHQKAWYFLGASHHCFYGKQGHQVAVTNEVQQILAKTPSSNGT